MTRPVTEPLARLFVAADLPPEALEAIAEWQRAEIEPRAELRVVRTLHLTLCFLGNVPGSRVDEIVAALGAVKLPPLPTGLGEVLFLPERGRKRVVTLRLHDPREAITAAQRELSQALAAIKVYKPERRAYVPHVTVARYRRPGQQLPLQNVNFLEFGLPHVTLYDSVLARGGAVHTPLASFPAG
jgi:RNA 2',3'-cyclic 3'-phosphodiesterase